MIDHVSLPVADVARAATFYDRVLATIGLSRRKELPGAIGYGPADRAAPVFWILARRDAGAPGPRPEYTQPFYGAFVLDPDGFKIEAVCRQDQGSDERVAQ